MAINKREAGDCGYVFFYFGTRVEVYAASQLAAKEIAVAHFKPPKSKRHMVHGMLAETADGKPVIHTAT